ncbi:MAG: hypothetical protein IJC35_01175 [Oscillospiraceae bacterium]|nr:hypothetical protein [Oscillospiraceae bacterium]
MTHRESVWAKNLIALQDKEGKWGQFHTLSWPSDKPVTTEQALRRLEILGCTAEDACIQKAVSYLHSCLIGEKCIPDPTEKLHNWDIYVKLMLSAWLCRFTKEDAAANAVAETWGKVITAAFGCGEYSHEAYVSAYEEALGMKPRGGRLVDFRQFYILSLLPGHISPETENAVMRYVLDGPEGVYYCYEKPLLLPPAFSGKPAVRYLLTLELLARFTHARGQLHFAAGWLAENRLPDGTWDMGSGARDGVLFPLSDDWRKKESRVRDCTECAAALWQKLSG